MEDVIFGIFSVAIIIAGFYFVIEAFRARRDLKVNHTALFLITTGEEDATAQVETCENLLRIFATFGKPFALEAVVPHVGDKIHFYVAVRRELGRAPGKALEKLFGHYAVERIHDDHIVFNPHGVAAAAYLVKKDDSTLPIPTYYEIGADMFKDVLMGLAAVMDVGEGAAVQVIARPRTVRRGEKHLSPRFETNVRIVASAGSEFRARGILDGIFSGFEKFKCSGRNAFRAVKAKKCGAIVLQFLDRAFDEGQRIALSTPEFASIYHIVPQKDREGFAGPRG